MISRKAIKAAPKPKPAPKPTPKPAMKGMSGMPHDKMGGKKGKGC